MLSAKRKILKHSPEIIIEYFGLLLFLLSPFKFEYPATVLCIIVFVFVHLIWPECRFKTDSPLCPLNIAQMLFWAQVLVFPTIGLLSAYSRGSLPWLPSNLAINISLLINVIAYPSFAGSYHYASRRMEKPLPTRAGHKLKKAYYPFKPMTIIAFVYLCIGILGFYLFFESFNEYIYYILYPTYVFTLLNNISGTFRNGASNFLRAFLGIGVIIFWSIWLDAKKSTTNWPFKALLTVFISPLIIFINISYSYNRGAVFSPIIAMVAAFSLRVRRLSVRFVLISGVLLTFIAFIWG